MADLNQVRTSIERAVSSRLTQQADQFRKEVVEQVLREIAPLLASSAASGQGLSQPPSPTSDILSSTISAIQASTVQADILKALLEGVSKFSARAALFVVRGTTLAGWQARGFADDNIRGVTLDGSKGLAARAIQGRDRVSAAAVEFDSSFIQQHGAPTDGHSTVFPLVVRDKVAAILYCDSGQKAGQASDFSAIDVLTRHTCLWLELAAGKKTSGSQPSESGAGVGTASFTGAQIAAVVPPAEPSAKAGSGIESLSAEEQELHQKAQRFAKLLVDEIKLYNQSKVAEGKQNRDLYKVLREDIEKSRATYDKRYGGTPVAPARYFDSEIVRILADNDRSLMGSDFPA
jgi:hypothetical protein